MKINFLNDKIMGDEIAKLKSIRKKTYKKITIKNK
jgi:hypothetical protein